MLPGLTDNSPDNTCSQAVARLSEACKPPAQGHKKRFYK